MGVSVLIFTVITGFFAIRGYFNGFLRSCIKTGSFIAGYAAALLLAKPASVVLEKYLSLSGIMLHLAAGTAIFFAVMLIIRLVFWLMLGSKDDDELTMPSRLGGTVVGSLIGASIGILLVYTWSVYTDANNIDSANRKAEPVINHVAKIIVSKTAGSIMALTNTRDTTVKISEAFLANPVESADRISRISNNTDLQELLNNTRTQRLMRAGDIDSLMEIPAFDRLMKNEDMRALMKSSGFSVDNRTDLRATAKKLTAGYQAFQLAKNDPRVQNILTDPKFQAQLKAKNKLPLLFNPDFNILANIIFVEGVENVSAIEKQTANIDYVDGAGAVMLDVEEGSTRVYRKTDENGSPIYSDRPSKN